MGGYLNILIIAIGLGLVSLIGSVSKDLAIFTDIKYKIQGKSQLDVVYDIVEEKALEELENKLNDWQELLVKASQDVDLTEEEMAQYEKDKTELTEEEYKLVYKVNRRLGIWDEKAMDKYQDDLESYNKGETSIVPIFPKYYRIDNMGAKVNMWKLAEQIVIKSQVFPYSTGLEITEEEKDDFGIDISKTSTISYGQDYILDDFVKQDNLLNIPGLVDVSGNFDENKNLYTMTAVQLNEEDNKKILKYYEYSLIEDKYEEEKNASIELTDKDKWRDAIPLITTVYNKNTNLLESYIVVYSPSKKLFDLYQYSIIENQIAKIMDGNLEMDNKKLIETLKLEKDVDEEVYSNEIIDVKLSSSFNESMNIPHIIMASNRKCLYGNLKQIKKSSLINYYDYFPIISDEFESSQINYKSDNLDAEDWDISSFWSDAMNVGILKQMTKEAEEIYSNQAIALLDDEFENSTKEPIKLPDIKLLEEKSNFKDEKLKPVETSQVSQISLTSFSDKMSNLTKNVLMINYQGVLCEFLGSEELEEWDEAYEIDEIVNGTISVSSSRGDINRIQAIIKPKAEPFLLKNIEIEIEVFNQIDDIKTRGNSIYEAKVYNKGLEYRLKQRKRN